MCAGAVLGYALVRPGRRREDDPLVWRRALTPAIYPALLVEHAIVGAAGGSAHRGLRAGAIAGAEVTCATGVLWLATSEIAAHSPEEPALALLLHDSSGWSVGVPALDRDAHVRVLSLRF